jgi:hypothetical protein
MAPATDVDLALVAISQDLDRLTEITAEEAGKREALAELVSATRDDVRDFGGKLDEILRFVRGNADRLNEVDELRGRVARVEVDVARARLA